MVIAPLVAIGIGLTTYEVAIQLKEHSERRKYWDIARAHCDQSGKKLLRIGIRRGIFEPPNGDVTLDLDPVVLNIPGGTCGDERDMPFADKEFGVCFNEHTLEHLHSREDVELAVNECVRVADKAILLCPSPYSIISNLFCHTHYLRIWFDKDKIRVTNNDYRVLPDTLPLPSAIGQALVLKDKAPVVISQRGFLISSYEIKSI